MNKTASTLVFTWGNPSRGDDALGCLFHDALIHDNFEDVEVLTDFQLQIEHCTDLENRKRVIFVDADMTLSSNYSLKKITPDSSQAFTTHAMAPQSLMHVCTKVNTTGLPECWLLQIRGYDFELGKSLSQAAKNNLDLALAAIRSLIKNKNPKEA